MSGLPAGPYTVKNRSPVLGMSYSFLTVAIVDRVGHRAHVVNMTSESYRVIETERWLRDAWKEELAE